MENYLEQQPITDYPLWERYKGRHKLHTITFEITERCNFNCRHCYINQPAGDRQRKKNEMSREFILKTADEAINLGAVWCLLTGGEPLLRPDFSDIYIDLKRKGLLLMLFTNAGLITKEHINVFKEYPPYAIEVTIYGATRETFEKVTRKPGSFERFRHGLNLLVEHKIPVRLKAMALQSNVHEMQEIAKFARQYTADFYRFDPQLSLRADFDQERNEIIRQERLTQNQIVDLENRDDQRREALSKHCDKYIMSGPDRQTAYLLNCGAGNGSVVVSYDGRLKLCPYMLQPEFIYDLKQGSLADAWKTFIPNVRKTTTQNPEYLNRCNNCRIFNLCSWCAAHAYLETGQSDQPVEYLCQVAQARAGKSEKSHRDEK
ncbi:MAG: radical SAM protein [candidate division KSB1 bacterium]|nr:radical SAM protein [candidate division KSB1 bacterium]